MDVYAVVGLVILGYAVGYVVGRFGTVTVTILHQKAAPPAPDPPTGDPTEPVQKRRTMWG